MADADEPAELKRLLAEAPDDPDLWQRLGVALLNRWDLLEAAQAFLRAIESSPRDPFPWLYLGYILEAFESRVARSLYETAAEVMPELPAAYWCQGLLARKEGRLAHAAEMFDKAVVVGPNDSKSIQCLGEWQSFVATLTGRSGNKYWMWARTRPGELLSDMDAKALTDSARAALAIESVYFNDDGQYADVEADVLADDVTDGAVTPQVFEAFCASRRLRALGEDGRPVPEAAQQFNWSRWGQSVFTVIPPADADRAAEVYSRLVAFAGEHRLTLHAMVPGTGEIDLSSPGRLPPAWEELMQ